MPPACPASDLVPSPLMGEGRVRVPIFKGDHEVCEVWTEKLLILRLLHVLRGEICVRAFVPAEPRV
jgi:hypothetical protein